MDDFHLFGQHFRTWRERRGLSIKEAAGDIVTPQFLSQFERGKRNITINTFSRLLMAIGVDWGDFILDYPGERVDQAYALLGQDPNPSRLPELQASLEGRYLDNPDLKDIFLAAIVALDNINDQPDRISPKLQQQIATISKQPSPNTMEIDLFLMYRKHFPLSYTLEMKDLRLERLTTSLEVRDLNGVHNNLLALAMTVSYLSAEGYYLECQKLIDQLRHLLKGAVYQFYKDFFIATVLLEAQQVYLWLRQKNFQEAFPLARAILLIYDQMFAFTPEAYLRDYRAEFMKNFNRLNTSGKFLYEP